MSRRTWDVCIEDGCNVKPWKEGAKRCPAHKKEAEKRWRDEYRRRHQRVRFCQACGENEITGKFHYCERCRQELKPGHARRALRDIERAEQNQQIRQLLQIVAGRIMRIVNGTDTTPSSRQLRYLATVLNEAADAAEYRTVLRNKGPKMARVLVASRQKRVTNTEDGHERRSQQGHRAADDGPGVVGRAAGRAAGRASAQAGAAGAREGRAPGRGRAGDARASQGPDHGDGGPDDRVRAQAR